jgi:hypothetical protein
MLPLVIIFNDVNKKQEFYGGSPPGSNVYMKQKSSQKGADLFIKWFTEHFLKHIAI